MVKIGDLVRLKSWRHIINKTDWVSFKSENKNKVGVFVFLGSEDVDPNGRKLDPFERIEALGWIRGDTLKVQAKFECDSDGVIGSTDAPVKGFSFEDDGSLTVVIDYWPTPEIMVERIKDALNTEEDGEALIEVARNANRAEMELAATCIKVTDEMVERSALALEKAEKQGTYGWTDEQFDTWWNHDPLFNDKIKNWGHFSGTLKQKLLWETRLVLEVALPSVVEVPKQVAPVDIYKVLKKASENGTLDADHLSSLAREIAEALNND